MVFGFHSPPPPPPPSEDRDELGPDSPSSARSSYPLTAHPRIRSSFSSSPSFELAGRPDIPSHSGLLSAPSRPNPGSSISSISSTAMNTPVPSRSNSPMPPHYFSGMSSASTSDTDSEPSSPLLGATMLGDSRRESWLRDEQRRWWTLGPDSPRRRRVHRSYTFRVARRALKKIIRHPLFPIRPIPILLTLLLLAFLVVSITLLLIHILNPDKEPLPWRAYCAAPSTSTAPPSLHAPATSAPDLSAISSGPSLTPFPPSNLDSLPPAGVLIGVFSMDSAFERRMLVRTTWANHPRSREGAGLGDGGNGTSRTIVRFILGQPRKTWERRVQLEMEKFNDIVLLPIPENMNAGKSHAFFTWAATDAWVPPLYFDSNMPLPKFSYSNETIPPPRLARHDPAHTWIDSDSPHPQPWVRPDFVVKADDDSFVMIAELESRLRLELHEKPARYGAAVRLSDQNHHLLALRDDGLPRSSPSIDADLPETSSLAPYERSTESGAPDSPVPRDSGPLSEHDPMIYWGYLVKNRFMAGELYALSWSLVDWVSKDTAVKGLTRGAEDKQTSKWMRLHPRADDVRWKSERCWIYDHPRAGTVYSHGFLFPSEAARARRGIMSYFDKTPQDLNGHLPASSTAPAGAGGNAPIPSAWSTSTVTSFGTRYVPPLSNLTSQQSVEALVEGSDMSLLQEGGTLTAEDAWVQREGRRTRYENKRVGGTVVVHFIKKNMWFLEAALALLEGDEETELDKSRHQYVSKWRHPPPERGRTHSHRRRRR